jgi:hypothetical protein
VTPAGTQRQRFDPPHGGERQHPVEVREQVAASRHLPFQRAVERLRIDRHHHQVGGAGEMPLRGLADLRRGREMDEAVADVDGGAAKVAGALGRAPLGRPADFVDGGHGWRLGGNRSIGTAAPRRRGDVQ